jgi:predicted  nucleic acid-binding Zn-ribbon protein
MEMKAAQLRIKNEIKFLYVKKQHLNKSLFALHLENAKKWGNLWDLIHRNLLDKIEDKVSAKYRNINKKLQKLKDQATHTKTTTGKENNNFYARTVNLTSVNFTHEELLFFYKGLKYNLHYKHKDWIKTLAIEADTAVRI